MINRGSSIESSCVQTLRQLNDAKQQWALEQGQRMEAIPSWQNLAPYFLERDENGASKPLKMPLHPDAAWPAGWTALSSERFDRYMATNGPLAFCAAGGTYELRSVEEEPFCSMGSGATNDGPD